MKASPGLPRRSWRPPSRASSGALPKPAPASADAAYENAGAAESKSGSAKSSAAGSTCQATSSGNVQKTSQPAEWPRHADRHQPLPLSGQGPQCAAAVAHIVLAPAGRFLTIATLRWHGRIRPIDPQAPKWAKKGLFAMLMLDEALARATTHVDRRTRLRFQWPGTAGSSTAISTTRATARKFEDYFLTAAAELPRGRRGWCARAAGISWTSPTTCISLINLATVRSLEEQWGVADRPAALPRQFLRRRRRPGRSSIGSAAISVSAAPKFRVDRRNGRCGATNVNPVTGRRDLDIPGSLRAAFGHKDLGVYLVAREGGIAVGDPVEVPRIDGVPRDRRRREPPVMAAAASSVAAAISSTMNRRAAASAIAPGTAFADIPAAWRCPDCGTDKTTFRPYLDGNQPEPVLPMRR